MRVIIVRRTKGIALSMDVYANGLVAGLKTVRPNWEIVEIAPYMWTHDSNAWTSGTGLSKYYERFWNHPRNVQRQTADIFHIIDHSNSHIAYWLNKISNKAARPTVVTCHDLVQFVYPENLRDQSRFPALSMKTWHYSVRGMRHADQVIAVSANTAKDLKQRLGIAPQKITVIPNGIEPNFQVLTSDQIEALRQQYNTPPNTLCLLNVGTVHQRKNIPTVLNVLKVLKSRNIPFRLWRTGDEFNLEQKQFIYENDLEKDIIYLGKPDIDLLVQIYNAADILLAPSLYEGFGLTIVEAMACGTPVITSNVSSLPEVAGNAAILVDPLDVSAMVAAIERLMKNSQYRQQLIDCGLERAKLFSWQKTAEQVAQVYEGVLHFQTSKSQPSRLLYQFQAQIQAQK